MTYLSHHLDFRSVFLTLFILSAYAVGVLSVSHYLPSIVDFFVNLQSGIVLFYGLSVMLIIHRPNVIGLDSLFWLMLFILLLLQPLLHSIAYPDALIFPLAMVLGCYLISVLVNSMTNKQGIIWILAFGIWLVGLVTLLLQGLQYYGYQSDYVLYLQTESVRFYGNLGQPNQTAFVLALALLSNYFLAQHQWQVQSYSIKKYPLSLIGLFCSTAILLCIGIALTASRAGLIFIVSIVFFPIIITSNTRVFTWRKKMGWMSLAVVLASLGYTVGLWLLKVYKSTHILSVVNRSIEDLHFRWYLIEQAWLSFSSSPFIGVGWNNFVQDSLNHVEQLSWFPFALHSHNILGQIAAEYGIIGLGLCLVAMLIFLRQLFQKNDLATSYILFMVALIILYSFSEFPLWIFKYLLLFAFLLGILNTKQYTTKLNFSGLYLTLSLIAYITSLFYYQRYIDYNIVAIMLKENYEQIQNYHQNPKKQQEIRNELFKDVNDLPTIFGFSDYKEVYIYQILPMDNQQITEKIAFGNRVLSNHMSDYVLTKQATYYGLNHQNNQSLLMFKGACFLYEYQSCSAVNDYLNQITKQNANFIPIRDEFNEWIQRNPKAKIAIYKQEKKLKVDTPK